MLGSYFLILCLIYYGYFSVQCYDHQDGSPDEQSVNSNNHNQQQGSLTSTPAAVTQNTNNGVHQVGGVPVSTSVTSTTSGAGGSGSGGSSSIRIIQDVDDEASSSNNGRGGATSSERRHRSGTTINFASDTAGALVLASSEECSGFSNILKDDKDKYAMCPCSAKRKWVTIGLSEDVRMDDMPCIIFCCMSVLG